MIFPEVAQNSPSLPSSENSPNIPDLWTTCQSNHGMHFTRHCNICAWTNLWTL